MMYNVSFKAELKINSNLYENFPKGTPDGYLENVIKNYQKFIKNPAINKILGTDIIEISKNITKKNRFDILLDFINTDTGEITKAGCFGYTKITDITFGNFIRQTCMYIGKKYNIKNKLLEKNSNYFKRVLKEAFEKSKK